MVDLAILTTCLDRSIHPGAPTLPRSMLPYGRSAVHVNPSRKMPGWISVVINPPKAVHGHNALLLRPDIDAGVLVGVVATLAKAFPELSSQPSQWFVNKVELTVDFEDDDPTAFVKRFFRFHGADSCEPRLVLSTSGDGATCYLKRKSYVHRLYDKGAEMRRRRHSEEIAREVARTVRYELVASRDKLQRLGLSNRLDAFCEHLRDGSAESVLTKQFEQTVLSIPPCGEGLLSFIGSELKGARLRRVREYLRLVEEAGAKEAVAMFGGSQSTLHLTCRNLADCAIAFRKSMPSL